MSEGKLRPETLAAQASGRVDKATGAIIPPIHPSATYERGADLSYAHGRLYSRADNPSYDAAADTLTALEGGAATLLFASGMAAATAVFQALDPGNHVVVPKVMYWTLRAWLLGFASRWGLEAEAVANGRQRHLCLEGR
ncbi:MAG: PLP-dependent transferase [Rhodomicrobium sp.]